MHSTIDLLAAGMKTSVSRALVSRFRARMVTGVLAREVQK
jgi:hypothetical protein